MPVLRFHLLTIDHEMVEGGFIVTITTNAACHLYLRYSDVFPRIHRKSVARRGLVIGWDARYCFTVYYHIEQNEPGDTWTHTFTWPGWSDCETRYFYFWGTMGGQDMVSDTPIFWLHYLWEEFPPYDSFYPDAHPEVATVDGHCRNSPDDPAESWANMRDGPGDSNDSEGPYDFIGIYSGTPAGHWDALYRSLLLFDTSSIGAGKSIIAARLRVKTHSNLPVPFWPNLSLVVVASLPFLNTQLRNADFATLGLVPFSNILGWGAFTPGSTDYFYFTQAGKDAIDPLGITKVGIRENAYDLNNIQPPWTFPGYARIGFHSAEHADILYKPCLQVAYI